MPNEFVRKRHVNDLKVYNEPLPDVSDDVLSPESLPEEPSPPRRTLRPRSNVNYKDKDLRKGN